MLNSELNTKIVNRGKEFFGSISGEKPSLFNKGAWMGKAMDWSMQNEQFKIQMFRFVDVFPSLTTSKLLTEHIREYFGNEQEMPAFMSTGAKVAGMLGSFGGAVLNKVLTSNIEEMARQFIVGETTKEAVKNLEKLRKDGFAAVVDVLGEATLSEEEAEVYTNTYLELLEALKKEQGSWKGLPGKGGDPNLDWGHAPKVNIAVKPTALFCLANPQDFEGSVVAILDRMRRIFKKVMELNGFLCIDMESYRHKEIILEVFRRLKLEYRDYPHLGIVLQAYLKDNDKDLDDLLAWAKEHKVQISVRLVKGAYWDYETVKAKQNDWEVPVWTIKAESDAAYERQARKILENHQICHFACASHNIRTISAVMEMARELNVPEDRYEFQVLYGMAEPVRKGILKVAGRIRLYAPYGNMVPGMGYLVRRLLENTANESFLRQSFAEDAQIERLLEDPAVTVERERAARSAKPKKERKGPGGLPPFNNEAMVDFTRADHRAAFPKHIAEVRTQLGKTYPLFINGKEVRTNDLIPTVNPNKPSEVLGQICQAGTKEVGDAIAAAKAAFPAWRDTDPRTRAEYLLKAAQAARKRLFELSAWQVLEIGKQWDQAYADVTEAIDFLEYYAREMIRLGQPQRVGHAPGELNHYFYEPKGVAAVIAPWNFPLAISMGMASAAIVTGNCVVFKPSGITSIIGWHLVELFREAGLPEGVFNFTPGRGSVMGDYLVDHPDISLIAFTGSMETGLRIIERAAKVYPGQANVKKIISEMGGKNAVIIDDDADLDEAVPHVLYSAFGFQGQKCSACSRVIVLDAVYDKFIERLVSMAKATKVGPSEDPANYMGAVADDKAMKSIKEYAEIGKREGHVLYESPVPAGEGYFVPMTIIGGIKPEHRIAQEEIFGPVLAVMRAKDFDQAIEWANSTQFALTGGIFSRSPEHLAKARREFRVGNLYINRNNTGALVERQPFGGARMSGVGTKAGGPDYLLHFMDPRVVTENTMRRGFAPIEEDDDWVD
ncbi:MULTISPECIES: L-glutamate gamma-semialdehyde dehydrogenase [Geobacter]|uniref:L-glutamate gamma-semialdehyde dehydrogenase n=1 Tax=Geobacter TaxID=28231 RepID=UPI002573C390|nr:L-glutamate gamma-semialdehyde dehydrogenase [Geobacter sulfurreducens]BEH11928.1 L-glutamate gamma-semialdehyde dehydrogenase [Geobacter sulfurreducens subsp. ethanolicus]BET59794.1 L-glutamate gamma-semialdehyde dehydrogenase [Geobacter sp. 60473]HML77202.1 L-glutamate gamma-semialdehyde dehydrogenase [Geobacter sulfurreducens]